MPKIDIGIETSSWLNIAAGLVVGFVAYYQTTSYDAPFYSGVVSGVLLVLIGAYTAWAGATDRGRTTMWPSVATLLVGLWLVGYPWFASVNDTYLYATAAVGAVAAIVSGYEIYAASTVESRMPRPPAA